MDPRAGSWASRLGLAITLAATVLLRVRLLGVPLERDEGEYAYMGQLILQGEVPYLAAHNMKLPGVYYAYAGAMALFGQTEVAIHVALLLVNLLSIVLLYHLGRTLLDAGAGVVAGAAWAVLSLSASVSGFAANAEHFVVVAMLGGVLLLARLGETRRLVAIAGAGLLLGVAFVMKQHAAAFLVFGGLSLVFDGLRRGVWPTVVEAVVFALASVAPFGLVCLGMYRAGAFEPFWFWTVTYAREYVAMMPVAVGLQNLGREGASILAAAPGVWLLAAIGAVAIWRPRVARRSAGFLGLFAACSVAAVGTGFRFSDHYFILLLPAASLLAGAAVSVAAGSAPVERFGVARLIRVGVPLVAVLLAVVQARSLLFADSPRAISRAVYGANPFPEAVEVARYIREHSGPEDRVAVIGSEPEIYFYARRRAATRYIYMYPLMEPHPFAHRMQEEMIAEIERAQPRFMVLVNVDTSWTRRPESSTRVLDWVVNVANEAYAPVGVADIMPDGVTVYRWGDDARAAELRSRFHVVVFERRA